MILVLVAVTFGLSGCGGGGSSSTTPSSTPTSATVVATEVWTGSNGKGDANTTFTKYSDGSIKTTGTWTYNYNGAIVTCPISAGTATITGNNIAFTATGTATNPGAPAGYQTSPFTLQVQGATSGATASGTFSISFSTTGWPGTVSGNWTTTKQSGSGVTSSSTTTVNPFVGTWKGTNNNGDVSLDEFNSNMTYKISGGYRTSSQYEAGTYSYTGTYPNFTFTGVVTDNQDGEMGIGAANGASVSGTSTFTDITHFSITVGGNTINLVKQ